VRSGYVSRCDARASTVRVGDGGTHRSSPPFASCDRSFVMMVMMMMTLTTTGDDAMTRMVLYLSMRRDRWTALGGLTKETR